MNDLLPSIDSRIAVLNNLKQKIQSEGILKKHEGKIITLSREFGCEAYPLATALKAKLEQFTQQSWTVFKEGAIDKTPSDSILSGNLSSRFGEQSRYLDAIVSALIPNWKTEQENYQEVVKTVFAIAQKGNAILIGRGASFITKDLSNCFHFRLIGSTEFRAKSYAKRHHVPIDVAEKTVVDQERFRKAFLKRFLGTRFNSHNFHLIINCEKIPADSIADTIISFMYELHHP